MSKKYCLYEDYTCSDTLPENIKSSEFREYSSQEECQKKCPESLNKKIRSLKNMTDLGPEDIFLLKTLEYKKSRRKEVEAQRKIQAEQERERKLQLELENKKMEERRKKAETERLNELKRKAQVEEEFQRNQKRKLEETSQWMYCNRETYECQKEKPRNFVEGDRYQKGSCAQTCLSKIPIEIRKIEKTKDPLLKQRLEFLKSKYNSFESQYRKEIVEQRKKDQLEKEQIELAKQQLQEQRKKDAERERELEKKFSEIDRIRKMNKEKTTASIGNAFSTLTDYQQKLEEEKFKRELESKTKIEKEITMREKRKLEALSSNQKDSESDTWPLSKIEQFYIDYDKYKKERQKTNDPKTKLNLDFDLIQKYSTMLSDVSKLPKKLLSNAVTSLKLDDQKMTRFDIVMEIYNKINEKNENKIVLQKDLWFSLVDRRNNKHVIFTTCKIIKNKPKELELWFSEPTTFFKEKDLTISGKYLREKKSREILHDMYSQIDRFRKSDKDETLPDNIEIYFQTWDQIFFSIFIDKLSNWKIVKFNAQSPGDPYLIVLLRIE